MSTEFRSIGEPTYDLFSGILASIEAISATVDSLGGDTLSIDLTPVVDSLEELEKRIIHDRELQASILNELRRLRVIMEEETGIDTRDIEIEEEL